MNGKNINFDNKKIQKSKFYKNKKAFQINDVDAIKLLVSEKEPYAQRTHLNTLLDIIVMMLFDHYV